MQQTVITPCLVTEARDAKFPQIQAHVTTQWNTIHNMLERYTESTASCILCFTGQTSAYYMKDTAMLSD